MDNSGSSIINPTNVEMSNKFGISGSTLKLIAIITMLIDHIAAAVIEKFLYAKGLGSSDTQVIQDFIAKYNDLYNTYCIMRLIGRLAFPIFCFLLVQGFLHTRNVKRYAIRLAVFALISEIPFDLAFYGKLLEFSHQNVFFTLLIGLLVMIGFNYITEEVDLKRLRVLAILGIIIIGSVLAAAVVRAATFGYETGVVGDTIKSTGITAIILAIIFSLVAFMIYKIMCKKSSVQKTNIKFVDLAILLAGTILADTLLTDYSGFGVITIAIMYGLRKNHLQAMLGGCITLTIMSISEITSFFVLAPIKFYNGKRGMNLKYVFYAFYPVHLFILYLVCYNMGLV